MALLIGHIYKLRNKKYTLWVFQLEEMTWEKCRWCEKDQNEKMTHDLKLAKELSKKVASFIKLDAYKFKIY